MRCGRGRRRPTTWSPSTSDTCVTSLASRGCCTPCAALVTRCANDDAPAQARPLWSRCRGARPPGLRSAPVRAAVARRGDEPGRGSASAGGAGGGLARRDREPGVSALDRARGPAYEQRRLRRSLRPRLEPDLCAGRAERLPTAALEPTARHGARGLRGLL